MSRCASSIARASHRISAGSKRRAKKIPIPIVAWSSIAGLDRQRTFMIGNSPRSDINPALRAGLRAAIYIPPRANLGHGARGARRRRTRESSNCPPSAHYWTYSKIDSDFALLRVWGLPSVIQHNRSHTDGRANRRCRCARSIGCGAALSMRSKSPTSRCRCARCRPRCKASLHAKSATFTSTWTRTWSASSSRSM